MSRSYVTFETIGTCELCGATDHHLVEGVCPVCRPKTVTVGDQAPQLTITYTPALGRQQGKRAALRRMAAAALRAIINDTTEEVPLGAEADVSHLRLPKGGAR